MLDGRAESYTVHRSMDTSHSFLPLLIVLLIAFAVPILLSRFERFSIPIVVGEIVAGMLVGRSGLKLVVPGDPLLIILANFGIVFLMFLSGMEIDFQTLRSTNARRGAMFENRSPFRRG